MLCSIRLKLRNMLIFYVISTLDSNESLNVGFNLKHCTVLEGDQFQFQFSFFYISSYVMYYLQIGHAHRLLTFNLGGSCHN